MEIAVTGLDANIIALNSEVEKVIALLQKSGDVTEKSKLAEIIQTLSSTQRNLAETISILQDQALDLFDDDLNDEEDYFDDFDEDEVNSFMSSKQVEFKSKPKKGKNKKKARHDEGVDDEDLPF
jgi:hypothetical protein